MKERDGLGRGKSLCGSQWKIASGLQWVRIFVGSTTQRDTFRFVKALANKRSDTIRDAMIDMQLLLRGVWRFHSDEGRDVYGRS